MKFGSCSVALPDLKLVKKGSLPDYKETVKEPEAEDSFEEVSSENTEHNSNDFEFIKPMMPVNPSGFKGLAAVLIYALEHRIWKEENMIDIGHDKPAREINGFLARAAEEFRQKIKEVMDIGNIIKGLKNEKHQLLENITNEIGFKCDFGFLKTEKESSEDVMKQTMKEMKSMFTTLSKEIKEIKTSVASLES